jgi:lambda family phage portal protein
MSKVIKPQVRQWQTAETSKFLENWITSGRPADFDIRFGLRTIRARARLDAQNVDHVRGFLNLVVSNVVGRNGVTLQSAARLSNGKPDKKLQAIVEEQWAVWGKRGVCDVTGQFSWAMLQRQAILTVARDGEAIYRIAEGFDNPFGFALQEIDPECLDINFNQSRDRNRNEIRMGVEFDQWRRPIAYYLTEEPNLYGTYNYTSDHIRIPAREIIHLYRPEWTFQSRGVPWTATSLARMHVLSSYEDAEVAAASVSARKLGFYKLSPEAPQELLDAGPQTHDVGVGEFEQLPPYTEFQAWDPQHPTTAYGDFVKSCLRSISTGLGVSYNTLANDLEGVNYSSLRQGAIQERDLWMTLQDWFVESFCQPIFDRWIEQSQANGILDAIPGRKLTEARRVNWQPRRWQWVDPVKDMEANALAVDLRTRSISDIIREQGRDPDEVWTELASDMEKLKSMGLDIQSVTTKGDTNAGTATDQTN